MPHYLTSFCCVRLLLILLVRFSAFIVLNISNHCKLATLAANTFVKRYRLALLFLLISQALNATSYADLVFHFMYSQLKERPCLPLLLMPGGRHGHQHVLRWFQVHEHVYLSILLAVDHINTGLQFFILLFVMFDAFFNFF